MTRATDGRTVLGVAAAAAVPAALLHALAGEGRRALGLSAPPFGPPQLLVAQVAAAVPLGWIVATVVGRRARGVGIAMSGCAGLLLAVAVAGLGPAIGQLLDADGAGFLARAAVRSTLAVALVAPWLVPWARRAAGPGATAVAAGLLLATLPPLAFAYRLTETRTAEAASLLDTGRLARAGAVLEGLCEIGSWRPVAGAAPSDARRRVVASLGRLRRETRGEGPAPRSARARLERAFAFIQLDRDDDAEALLRPLADADPDAAVLLLAAIDRDRGRWADCERAYRRVLGAGGVSDPDLLVTAYDGLAEALRSSGRPGEASAVYREAAGRLPGRAGYFAMQIGRHELDAGRPPVALAALSEAVRLDPSLAPRAEPLFRQVRVRTPACLLARPARRAASPGP